MYQPSPPDPTKSGEDTMVDRPLRQDPMENAPDLPHNSDTSTCNQPTQPQINATVSLNDIPCLDVFTEYVKVYLAGNPVNTQTLPIPGIPTLPFLLKLSNGEILDPSKITVTPMTLLIISSLPAATTDATTITSPSPRSGRRLLQQHSSTPPPSSPPSDHPREGQEKRKPHLRSETRQT